MFADASTTARKAYERMTLDRDHKWASYTQYEVDFLSRALEIGPSATILDLGCGPGRHALELARRGDAIVGVDFVPGFIDRARGIAEREGLADKATFHVKDCRALDLGRTFDVVLCLYDVIGSFPDDEDNCALVRRVARHLRPGGQALLSVLNKATIAARVKRQGRILDSFEALLQLPPSKAMQETWEIFDPDKLFLGPETSIVYRKEQFEGDSHLPTEVIVRDRRYERGELIDLCRQEGIETTWARHVRAKHWDDDYPPTDPHAKEVLLLGRPC